jgi:hypothetical protein
MTDNTTVRQYVNKKGGTRSPTLCALTLKLYNWCIEHDISLVAQHVPGVSNVLADSLSRKFHSDLEWRLDPKVVHMLFQKWGSPNIDLFASNANKHCLVYASWYPEVDAFHVDALTLSWSGMFAYAFPPIPIIHKVIQKVRKDQSEMILITPYWPTRTWFNPLLELLIDDPIKLPIYSGLLTQDKGRLVHHNPAQWSPVAWRISGRSSAVKDYQTRLSKQSWHQNPQLHSVNTNPVGNITLDMLGIRASIHFQALSNRS